MLTGAGLGDKASLETLVPEQSVCYIWAYLGMWAAGVKVQEREK